MNERDGSGDVLRSGTATRTRIGAAIERAFGSLMDEAVTPTCPGVLPGLTGAEAVTANLRAGDLSRAGDAPAAHGERPRLGHVRSTRRAADQWLAAVRAGRVSPVGSPGTLRAAGARVEAHGPHRLAVQPVEEQPEEEVSA